MKKQLVKIDLKKMTALSVVMFLVPLAISVPLELTALKDFNTVVHWYDILIIIVAYLVLIVVHEGIHALAMLMVGVPRKNIRFGVILKQGMAYCACDVPLTADKYMFVLILPLIVTGIIPWILSTVFLNIIYTCMFIGMIAGAAGDLSMILKLTKYSSSQLVLDHPKAPAFYLMYEEDKAPEGFREVTEEEEQALLDELYRKKKK